MQETWETQVQSLGWDDPLEKEMATHSSVLAWRIPWTEEPGRLQSMVLKRVRYNWSDLACTHKLLEEQKAWIFKTPIGLHNIHIGSVIKVHDKYGHLGKVISGRKGGRLISTRVPWRLLDGSRLWGTVVVQVVFLQIALGGDRTPEIRVS